MGNGKEILKFDGGEEIEPCIECTYLFRYKNRPDGR